MFCFSFIASAQVTPKYTLQFFSETDSMPVPFIVLKTTDQEQIIGSWNSNLDGVIILDGVELKTQTKFSASSPGYESINIGMEDIKSGEITKFYLREPLYLNKVIIASYYLPLDTVHNNNMDSLKWYDNLYSATMDSIKTGSWFISNQQKLTIAYSHYPEVLTKLITYPETVKRCRIEETIYFSLNLDAKGYISDLKLEKGNNSLFVVYASRAMASLLRIVPNDEIEIQLRGQQKIRVIQGIQFQLK
jgi:hypothetical protein